MFNNLTTKNLLSLETPPSLLLFFFVMDRSDLRRAAAPPEDFLRQEGAACNDPDSDAYETESEPDPDEYRISSFPLDEGEKETILKNLKITMNDRIGEPGSPEPSPEPSPEEHKASAEARELFAAPPLAREQWRELNIVGKPLSFQDALDFDNYYAKKHPDFLTMLDEALEHYAQYIRSPEERRQFARHWLQQCKLGQDARNAPQDLTRLKRKLRKLEQKKEALKDGKEYALVTMMKRHRIDTAIAKIRLKRRFIKKQRSVYRGMLQAVDYFASQQDADASLSTAQEVQEFNALEEEAKRAERAMTEAVGRVLQAVPRNALPRVLAAWYKIVEALAHNECIYVPEEHFQQFQFADELRTVLQMRFVGICATVAGKEVLLTHGTRSADEFPDHEADWWPNGVQRGTPLKLDQLRYIIQIESTNFNAADNHSFRVHAAVDHAL